jgi:Rod binding domain-containing protein
MSMDAISLQFNQADPAAWRERLVHGSAPESERLGAVSREFEAVLLRSYLSEALKPLTKDGSAFGGNNSIYGYMITDALANSLSSSGTFGFSNLMQAQLAGPATLDHDDHTDTP